MCNFLIVPPRCFVIQLIKQFRRRQVEVNGLGLLNLSWKFTLNWNGENIRLTKKPCFRFMNRKELSELRILHLLLDMIFRPLITSGDC